MISLEICVPFDEPVRTCRAGVLVLVARVRSRFSFHFLYKEKNCG
jgi:hypothetical protein